MIKEHTWRPVHLRNDDTLGAIDHKGAVFGHERHIAHVNVLLFNVADRLRAGFLLNIPNHQSQGHLQRRRKGQATLLAFLNVIFWGFQLIADKFQHRALGKVTDRENRFEDSLQAHILTVRSGNTDLQKKVIGALLNLDQIRHWRNFINAPKIAPDALPTSKRGNHRRRHHQSSSTTGPATTLSPATITHSTGRHCHKRS